MLTPDQELESRANPEAPLCANCGHEFDFHCYKADGGFEMVRCRHPHKTKRQICMCPTWEPAGLEDVLADEGKL